MTEKIKRRVGRPRLFETEEELELAINAYFEQCETTKEPLTITGLAWACGCDRQSLLNWSKEKMFFGTIKQAREIIENAAELRGLERGTIMDIFRLKNLGWKDKQEIDFIPYHPQPVVKELE